MTPSHREYADLLVTASLTVAVMLLVLVVPPTPVTAALRTALGLCFVVAAPGYALAATMFPRRADVPGVERLALSLGLSIAVLPVLALVLNATSLGIRLAPMTLGVCSLTLLFLGLAALLRRRLSSEEPFFGEADAGTLRRASLVVLCLVLFSSGVIAAATLLRPPAQVTEFYLLRADTAAGNSALVAPGESFPVTLGVTNHEGGETSFVIRIPELDSRSIQVPELDRGGRWETTIEVEAPASTTSDARALLSFELYRPNDEVPYRLLRLFVPLRAGLLGPATAPRAGATHDRA